MTCYVVIYPLHFHPLFISLKFNIHTRITYLHTHTTVPPANVSVTQLSNPIIRNEEIRLECSADGFPASNFTWTYNGTTDLTKLSRMPDSRHRVLQSRGQILTVNRAEYSDAGLYTCTATNIAGTNSASISVVGIRGKKWDIKINYAQLMQHA